MIAISESVQAQEVREQMRKMRAKGWQHDHSVKSIAKRRRLTVERVEELIATRVRAPQKRKNELRKKTGPVPVTREQVLDDLATMADLPIKVAIRKVSAYYGLEVGRVSAMAGYNAEKSCGSPPYEPDAEEIATRTAALRENWSDHVRTVRAGEREHYACEIETPVFPGCMDGEQR